MVAKYDLLPVKRTAIKLQYTCITLNKCSCDKINWKKPKHQDFQVHLSKKKSAEKKVYNILVKYLAWLMKLLARPTVLNTLPFTHNILSVNQIK